MAYLKYRPEIDGLRAWAVLPVLLFHAGIPGFSGGYIGVDIFFVISGFLITGILLREIDVGDFSLFRFYERRARRILPALYFVIFLSIPVGWFAMLPLQYEKFTTSIIWVALFLSNIFFDQTTGYFDAAAEEQPLLHTWSLAVEEQFYLGFPLLLLFLWRSGPKQTVLVLSLIAAISLTWAQVEATRGDGGGFYVIQTRIWELLVGSLAAIAMNTGKVRANDPIALIGLSLIVVAIFGFEKDTPFPSIYTLVPVLGTAAVILFGTSDTYVQRFLSWRPFVWVGLISYSLYLVHQPVLAFARVLSPVELSGLMGALLLIPCFGLAFVSWRFVERPFRNREQISTQKMVTVLSGLAVLALGFGAIGTATRGYETLMLQAKFTDKTADEYRLIKDTIDYDISEHMAVSECKFWDQTGAGPSQSELTTCYERFGNALVVIGDSHAMNVFNIISKSGSFDFIVGFSRGGCRPYENKSHCHYQKALEFLDDNAEMIGPTIYHQSGAHLILDTSGEVDSQKSFEGAFNGFEDDHIRGVFDYLDHISARSNGTIVWLGPFLEYRHEPLEVFGKTAGQSVNPRVGPIFENLNGHILNMLPLDKTWTYLPFSKVMIEPTEAFIDECFVFRDRDHYSRCGEDVIAKTLRADALK